MSLIERMLSIEKFKKRYSINAFLENKKQLHHCTSAIRNRTSISLNIINKHDHNQQASVSDDKSINEHSALQSLRTEFESTIIPD